VCGGEEDDWTDGQRRNIRPFRPGASSKDRSGRTMNPGLSRQGDIETPATVARYEEPAEAPISSMGAHDPLAGGRTMQKLP